MEGLRKERLSYEKLRKLGLHFCIKYNNIVHTTELCRECPYNISDDSTLDENTLNKESLNKNSDKPNKIYNNVS